jgi:hypothetical protein
MTQIMGQRDGFCEVFVEAEAACQHTRNLRDLKGVCQACTKQIAFVINKDLRFVFEPTKRTCVNNTIAITLEFAAIRGSGLWVTPPATRLWTAGVHSKFWCRLRHRYSR